MYGPSVRRELYFTFMAWGSPKRPPGALKHSKSPLVLGEKMKALIKVYVYAFKRIVLRDHIGDFQKRLLIMQSNANVQMTLLFNMATAIILSNSGI